MAWINGEENSQQPEDRRYKFALHIYTLPDKSTPCLTLGRSIFSDILLMEDQWSKIMVGYTLDLIKSNLGYRK